MKKHYMNVKFLLTGCLLFILFTASAQSVKINGRVIDAEGGSGLPGVNVFVKGSTNGTVTDAEGKFTIEGDGGSSLTFSFIGYATQEVAIDNRTEINVQLVVDITQLGEVVVVGYGSKSKTTLTGSVAVVSGDQLANRPTPNIITSLQGILPGATISRGNVGQVGREEENLGIQVRGVTSRVGGGPLVVIDGIIQGENGGVGSLTNINPNDVESVTLLKDSQAAIYGARGAGGVLIITTKSGKSSKPVISVNTSFTLNTPGIYRKQANILQAIDMWTESYENDGVNVNYYSHLKPFLTDPPDLNQITVAKGPFPDTKDIALSNNDWVKIMYGNALQQQHSISVSGKTDRSNYFVSMGLTDQPGSLNYGTNYNKKYQARLKYDFNVTDWLQFRTNLSLSTEKLIEPSDFGIIQDITAQSFAGKAKYTQSGKYYGFGGYLSTIGWAEQGGNRERRRTQLRTQFETVIKPIKNLGVTAQIAVNRNLADETALRTGFKSYTYDDELIFSSNLYYGGRDQVSASFIKDDQIVANLFANYKYNINRHAITALAGYTHEESEARNFSAYRNGNPSLLSTSLSYLGNGAADQQFNSESRSQLAYKSFIARVTYDFDQKYLFEANFRNDQSSKFNAGIKGENFFGVAGGWVISSENFMRALSKYVDFAKLRLSYGELGNPAALGNYDYIPQLRTGSEYPFGPVGAPIRTTSLRVPVLASPDRKWEKINTKNIGLDVTTLNTRLSLTFDYFIKTNTNLFYSKEFPSILGITPPSLNGGQLETTGYEIGIAWKDRFKSDEIGYSIGINLFDNTSKVLSLPDARVPAFGYNAYTEGYSPGSYFGYRYDGLIQGNDDLAAYNAKYGSNGIPTNLRTGDAKYKDLNNDGKLTPLLYDPEDPSKGGDFVNLGDNNQRYSFSVNLSIDYKGFYASAIFQGVGQWMV
ncbi:MAG: SusC/RagA family TonB-linked outer membrane protein, partial [Cyclobacteriaceae bacterium]|nr:SusC/RagA family TonB-linked outer membrane protein [Cyclobacteriaceae bacterium]